MSTFPINVQVNDSALVRLRGSVRDLNAALRGLGAGVDLDKSLQSQVNTVKLAAKGVSSATHAISKDAKQASAEASRSFDTIAPHLTALTSNLERVANAMDRLAARGQAAARKQVAALKEVTVAAQGTSAAELAAAAKTAAAGDAAGAARKASRSISGKAGDYSYRITERLATGDAESVINDYLNRQNTVRSLRERALVRAALDKQVSDVRKQLDTAQLESAKAINQWAGVRTPKILEGDSRGRATLMYQGLFDQIREGERAAELAQANLEMSVAKRAKSIISKAQTEGYRHAGADWWQNALYNEDRLRVVSARFQRSIQEDQQRLLDAAQSTSARTVNQWVGLREPAALTDSGRASRERSYARMFDQISGGERRTLDVEARFLGMSQQGQLRAALRAAKQLEGGIDSSKVSEAFGPSAMGLAGQGVDSIVGKLEQLRQATRGAVGGTMEFTEAQQQLHAAMRGLSGGMGQLWLTYGKYAALTAASFGAISVAQRGYSNVETLDYETRFAAALGTNLKETDFTGAVDALQVRLETGLVQASKEAFGSVTELATGLRVMQQAGYDASDALGTLGVVANASLVGESDFKTAAQDLVGVMELFQLHSDDPLTLAENFRRSGDILTYVASETKANLHEVASSFQNMIGVSEAYNVNIETAAALTEMLGKAGVVGGRSGTFTRNFFDEALGVSTKKGKEALSALGLEAFDLSKDDPVKYIDEMVKRIREFDHVSQTAITKGIFNERGLRVIRGLIGDVETLAEKVARVGEGAGGSLDKTADEVRKTARVMWQEVGDEFDDFLTSVFDGAEDSSRSLAKVLQDVFGSQELRSVFEQLLNMVQGIAEAPIQASSGNWEKLYNLPTDVVQRGVAMYNKRFAKSNEPTYDGANTRYGVIGGADLGGKTSSGAATYLDQFRGGAQQSKGAEGTLEKLLKAPAAGSKVFKPVPEGERRRLAMDEDRVLQELAKRVESAAKNFADQMTQGYDAAERLLKNVYERGEINSGQYLEATGNIASAKEGVAAESARMQVQEFAKAIEGANTEPYREKLTNMYLKAWQEYTKAQDKAGLDQTLRESDNLTEQVKKTREISRGTDEFVETLQRAAYEREQLFKLSQEADPVELAGLAARRDVLKQVADKMGDLAKLRKEFAGQTEVLAEISRAEEATMLQGASAAQAAEELARFQEAFSRTPESGLQGFMKELRSEASDLSTVVKDGLSGSLDIAREGFVNLATTGKMSIRGMVTDMLTHLSKLLAHKAFTMLAEIGLNYMMGSQSPAPVESRSFTPVTANAKGNAFTSTEMVRMFAKGGAFTNQLITSPTPFRFASGGAFAPGLMGEAGPEAVVPLTRTASGELGVRMVGGGAGGSVIQQSISVTVQYTSKGGSSEEDGQALGDEVAKSLKREMQALVLDTMAREKRPGGMLN